MGDQTRYNKNGGFSQYLYTHDKEDVIQYGNLVAKVVYKKGSKDYHESLPLYSNTPKMYFGLQGNKGKGGKKIDQLRFYDDRKAYMDFDWGHDHYVMKAGKVVRIFPKGTVHVQYFKLINGHPVRDENRPPRMLNNKEIRKFGAFLRKADPNVKFR